MILKSHGTRLGVNAISTCSIRMVTSCRLLSRCNELAKRMGPDEVCTAVMVDQRPLSRPRLNLPLNGNQAAEDADCYGFCPASGAELGENGADMELHGVFRDIELRSHLLISLPQSH